MKNFFAVKDKNISEKTFWQGLIISAVCILLCVVAFSAGTYAWFVGDVSSNSNTLTSGSFNVVVSVVGTVNGEIVEPAPHSTAEGGWEYDLSAGTYTVTLTLDDRASVKGHCIVVVGDRPAYHTAPIIGDSTANAAELPLSNPFVFTVTVSEETTLSVLPCWGLAVETQVANQGEIDLTPPAETADETEAETAEESEVGSEIEDEMEIETESQDAADIETDKEE